MQKKSFVAKIILFTCIFLLFAFLVFGRVYDVLRWKDTTGDYVSSLDQLYATDNDLIDVVFVGSSHVYCGIYPCFLWERAGISAFDMSVSGQDKDSSYHHLKELLKTQSPKLVCIDMYGLTYDTHLIEGNVYRNMLSMKPSLNSLALLKDYFADADISDFVFRWPIIHTRYKELKENDFIKNPVNLYLRGEEVVFDAGEAYPPQTDDTYGHAELSEKNLKWLNDLYELSQIEDFKLCFFVSPFSADAGKQSLMDSAYSFACDHGIDFFDFNRMGDEIGFDYSNDFSDPSHLNAYGAYKLSNFFSDYIVESIETEDHRDDKRYHQWDEDLKYYRHRYTLERLENASSLDEFIDIFIADGADSDLVISLEYDVNNSETDYFTPFSKLGIDASEVYEGGKWLYRDNKLTKLSSNDISEGRTIHPLNNDDSVVINFAGDGKADNLMIGFEDYSNKYSYVTAVIYSELFNEVSLRKDF